MILSIYYFLLKLCEGKNENAVSHARCVFLEKKTTHLFENYFKDYNSKIYTNYYLNYGICEKDILIICRNTALIIECKSKKYNEPLGNPEVSYQRIKKNFKESIQDAYRQVKEVEDLFYSLNEIIITDKKKNKIDVISTKKINKVVTIIVTQERFGQIQCDLGLLLDKNESDYYPWSVSIDDLESILLTFSRKENPLEVLISYLRSRQKLHTRLICYDELDLASYFLMQNREFVKNCHSNQVFIASPDVCNFFDDLYKSGFGFKNELDIENKIQLSIPSLITYELCKKLKLKVPDNIRQYKLQNKISDTPMKIFKSLLSIRNPNHQEFFDRIKDKSLPYNTFDQFISNKK